MALGASGVGAQPAYEQIVAPIFQARCVSCHGAEKQKGKLALHTWERIAQGGDSGPLWVAGKPGESELLRRLKLPEADDEHMPPVEEPQLTKDEVALLVRWIERGASEKIAVRELGLEPALLKALEELPRKLAEVEASIGGKEHGARELESGTVEQRRTGLAAKVAELQRKFPGALSYESRGSAALHFTAAGLGREFGDAELRALAEVGAELVVLDLSGTAVTEGAAEALSRLSRLRVLRLAFTGVGDDVARAVSRLRELETVVLTDSALSPSGVEALRGLGKLRKLHVGSSLAPAARAAGLPVVDAGIEALTPTPEAPPAKS